jgi:hypothetical protein
LEYHIRVNPTQRLAYIPKRLLETLGSSLVLLPDAKAAILYPEDADIHLITRSVEILLRELRFLATLKSTGPQARSSRFRPEHEKKERRDMQKNEPS